MKYNFAYIWDKTIILLLKQVVRVVAYMWPRDPKLIALGAWVGERYCDSPMYLARYLLENTQYKLVWIGKSQVAKSLPMHDRLEFAEKDTFRAALKLLRAGTWVCCISPEWDLSMWPLEGGAKLVNTWHGYGIKRTTNGKRVKRANVFGRIVRYFESRRSPWTMVGGEQDVDALIEGSPRYFRRERMLKIGTPSNDYLINFSKDAHYLCELKKRYAGKLGFDVNARIVTYLPTWRDSSDKVFAFYGMDAASQERWRDLLKGAHAVIVEKHHPRTLGEHPVPGVSKCSIPVSAELQREIDTQELLLITDILITDYSGAGQDFGVLRRPCIMFMYDLERYFATNSGLIDGWEKKVPGVIVKSEMELMEAVKQNLAHPNFSPAEEFKETCAYQMGTSCHNFVEWMEGH